MIFFFKKKPITIYCVTDRFEVLERAPIKPASKFLPSWWKRLPSTYKQPENFFPTFTMRNCDGFIKLYSQGAMLPLWSDLALKIHPIGDPSYRYQFADKTSKILTHGSIQHNNHYPEENFQHLKILAPWKIICNEEIKFLLASPTWSMIEKNTIQILPGILDFKYQHDINVNMFVARTPVAQELMLPFLEPLIHIIPLSERPLKIILSDDKKLNKKSSQGYFQVTFARGYKQYKQFKKHES